MALEFASKKETFPNYRKFETTLAGRPFVVETGKMCALSSGSCMVSYGDTRVLCNVTMSDKPREGIDFFPLSVDFEEKLYSVGRIPGSFMRREGRPGEKAVLTSRVIDQMCIRDRPFCVRTPSLRAMRICSFACLKRAISSLTLWWPWTWRASSFSATARRCRNMPSG